MSGISLMRERPPYVTFVLSAVEDRNASIETGRYIARDVEMVNIVPAGSKDMVEREAIPWLHDLETRSRMSPPQYNPEWAAHFRACYDAWKRGIDPPANGTPIRNWSVLSPAQITNLIGCHVLTVEDLAAANEEVMRAVGMGARDLKNKAVAYLEQASNSGAVVQRIAKLEVELEDALRQINDKNDAILALQSELAKAKPNTGSKRSTRERAEELRDERDIV